MDRCYHAQSNYHPADILKIHVTKAPPLEAYVAIQFQDLWFWIELHDTNSKNSFALIQYLTRLQQARGSLPNAGVLPDHSDELRGLRSTDTPVGRTPAMRAATARKAW